MSRRAAREFAYHLVAVGVAVVLWLLAARARFDAYTLGALLVTGYLLLGGIVLAGSPAWKASKPSAAVFAVALLGLVALATNDAVAYHARSSAETRAYAHRQQLLDANQRLPLGRSATLDSSLLGGRAGKSLRITPIAVRYDSGPLPSALVLSTAIADETEPPDGFWWLPEAGGKQARLWVGSSEPGSLSLDLVIMNRGTAAIDTAPLAHDLSLLRTDAGMRDCIAFVVRRGRFWMPAPAKVEPGQSIACTALFAVDVPDGDVESPVRGIALALPATAYRPRLSGGSPGWAVAASGRPLSYEDPSSPTGAREYAASWSL